MEKQKKLNKLKISIVIILIVIAFTVTVFGRYIYNSIRETYLTTQQFYFTSNILTTNGANYIYTGWDGQQPYIIEFDLYTYINQQTKLDYDLDYTVTCSTTYSNIECEITTPNGETAEDGLSATGKIISEKNSGNNSSIVAVEVTPLTTINEGESVKVMVEASTSKPYQKTISCEFTLRRETPVGVSYTVEDVSGREYAVLRLINTNFVEAKVTVEFDPTKLRIDSNDEVYVGREATGFGTQDVEGTDGNEYEYVNKFVFKIGAENSKYVKFYKVNKAQNYTYPGVQATSPIKVTL